MERKFEGKTIGVTRYSTTDPALNLALMRVVELKGGELVNIDSNRSENWEFTEIIAIGDEDFNIDYLVESVEMGLNYNLRCLYLSLEDFWYYWVDSFNENYQDPYFEPYFEGDARIENHAGLSFLASLYFEYPDVDILGYQISSNSKTGDWNIESILRKNFGYSVRRGISNGTQKGVRRSRQISSNYHPQRNCRPYCFPNKFEKRAK